ncbi:hypothetical protein OG339_41240 [Streptosporangium sp. NBC_01495]|uniref:hypothetical protein n=1 Tax=Streptosporangium sp. NBC_01495 TaxID=2903899 RepID=UPI002E2EFCA2|nr:hypothetical protein [Streptosporangium sp. NBC_01495]
MKFGIYPAYIGGRDVTGDNARFVHTLTARDLIEDTFPSLRLKRDFDLGTTDPHAAGERVVGACVVADESMTALALESAARAAPEWSRVPLGERVEIGRRIAERLLEHLFAGLFALLRILAGERMIPLHRRMPADLLDIPCR